MITGVLSGHSSLVYCVALSQDNSYVVSGDDTGIIVHSTKTGIVKYEYDNVFVGCGVNGLCCLCYLLNDLGVVACGWNEGRNNGLKVLSPSLGLVQDLEGHDVWVCCVTVSSTNLIASGGCDGKVIIWSESGEGGEWASGKC